MGEGLGDLLAACLAKVFSLEDALRLVAERGRCFSSYPEEKDLTLARDTLEACAWNIDFQFPTLPWLSAFTGHWMADAELPDATFWREQFGAPNQRQQAIAKLEFEAPSVILELGGDDLLAGIAEAKNRTLLPLPSGTEDDSTLLVNTLARLYLAGCDPDWVAFNEPTGGNRVELPTYPFQRKRYWIDPEPAATATVPDVVDAGSARARAGLPGTSIETELHKQRTLNRLCRVYMARTLKRLDLFNPTLLAHRFEQRLEQEAVHPQYRSLLKTWIDALTTDGLLCRDNGAFEVSAAGLSPDIDQSRERVHDAWGNDTLIPTLVQRCGERLDEILTGREPAMDVLFPGGSSNELAGVYRDSHWARYFNGIIQALFEQALRLFPADEPVRILEIGAGTGATTTDLLPLCPPDRARYIFTDIGDSFLHRARDAFKTWDFVEVQKLDIESGSLPEGLRPGSCQLVIAVNVLHATSDIDRSMQHARRLLASGGVLLLMEATEPQDWLSMTFGLLDGWSQFKDRRRDKNSPLLSRDEWLETFEQQGFESTTAFPPPEMKENALGQQVFFARKSAVPDEALQTSDSSPDLFYQLNWHPAPAPEEAAPVQGHWLIFADENGIMQRVAEALENTGATITLVPSRGDPDWVSTLHTMDRPEGVLHGRYLDAPPAGQTTAETLEA
ncbi:MAG: methyltransferase, partial [Verrucomicrobiota bacterium]